MQDNFFQQVWNKIFAKNETKKKYIEVKQVLERTKKEIKTYQNWKESKEKEQVLQKINQNYKNNKDQKSMYLLEFTGAKGWAWVDANSFHRNDFFCIMEYIKDFLIENKNYYLQNAEKTILEKENYVEFIEKYYLKPDIYQQAKNAEICNQQYGNILIQYVKINTKPAYLKMVASFYEDRQFTKVLPFQDLNQLLFNS
jgi:hypothetical protein